MENNQNDSSVHFGSFVSYKQVVLNSATDLKKLKEYSQYLKLEKTIELIDDVIHRIANDSFSVAIVGEFKRGKSTLINALLGKDILPSDILPCSATLNRVTYSITPSVKISYIDGREEEISIDELTNYVTKLTDQSAKISETVKEATVYYPVNFCKNNVDIVDTPGLNDDKSMTDITLSVLPQVDAAILVIMAQAPFSDFERDFLENKLLVNDLGRVMFVVTGIDRCDEDEADRVLAMISNRIQKYVLVKAEKALGANSEEFAVYRRKIGKPKVFGLSAKQALKAKLNGNNELLETSKFTAFETELERFLTEDRGAVFLQIPTNRIISASIEILKTIDIMETALSMKKEEFQAKNKEVTNELNNLKQKKIKETEKIKKAAEEAFASVNALAATIWDKLQVAANEVIDTANIEPSDIEKSKIEATQKRLMENVNEKLKQEGQIVAEQIQQEIENKLQAETIRLQDFSTEVANTIENINSMFKGVQSKGGVSEGIAAAAAMFTGLGGIWSGYRYAGAKGAAVGAAGSVGTLLGGGLLIGLLGIPVAWPAVLVIGVVSIFTGGWLTKKVFGGSQVEKFRGQLKEVLKEDLDNLRRSNDFSIKVKNQVNEAFSQLIKKVDEEVDAVVVDMQNTFMEIRSKIEKDEALSEQEKLKLKEIRENTICILENAKNLNLQMTAILEK